MKKEFLKNVKEIVDSGNIEGYEIKCQKLINTFFSDDMVSDHFYKGFENHFTESYDMLYTKCMDFVYRLDRYCNEYLVPCFLDKDMNELNYGINLIKNDNIDLYSAVSYDTNDTFEELFDYISVSNIGI